MSIYNRDNINYSQMIQNAIANRNAAAQRQAAYDQAKGKLWGDTTTNIAKNIGRGIYAELDENDEDEAELEKLLELKKQKEAIAKYNEQVEQRRAFDEIFNNPDKEFGIYNPKYNTPQGASLSEEGTRSMQDYVTVPMTDYKPNDYFKDEMADSYNQNYYNPYKLTLMEGVYRRGR